MVPRILQYCVHFAKGAEAYLKEKLPYFVAIRLIITVSTTRWFVHRTSYTIRVEEPVSIQKAASIQSKEFDAIICPRLVEYKLALSTDN